MLGAAGVPPKGSAPPGRARLLGHQIVLAGFQMAQDRTFGSDRVRTAGSTGKPNRCGFPQDRLRITAKAVREKKMQALRATAAAPRAASRPRLARASASSARVRRCGHRNWNVEVPGCRPVRLNAVPPRARLPSDVRKPRRYRSVFLPPAQSRRTVTLPGFRGAARSIGSSPTRVITSTRVPPTSAFALSTLPPRPYA